jgi:signal transduction histidine kinase
LDQVPPLIDDARQALNRLSRLTADLYEASRGEVPELERTPQDLGQVLTQACAWAEASAHEKGIAIIHEPCPAPLQVLGDGDALLSVMSNIISNGVRYTPAGGSITIRAGSHNSEAWVEITDTGIGMSEEVQSHIFERFYRSPDARRVEAQGLGLGLALAQQLVHAHGGTISVTSAPGAGSTFRIVLPLLQPSAAKSGMRGEANGQ